MKVGFYQKASMGALGALYVYGGYAYVNEVWPFQRRAYARAVKDATAAYEKIRASDSKSLLRRHLVQTTYDNMKFRATKHDGTLYQVIKSGLENPEASVGVYAPDAEAYTVFRELFDPIIQDYHNFSPSDRQPSVDLGDGKYDQLAPLDPKGKYIQSTRIRCGRSIEGLPLNTLMSEEDYKNMEGKVQNAVENFGDSELKGKYYPLLGMEKNTQKQLIADHFLFKDNDKHLESAGAFHYWPVGRGIFHNSAKNFLIWVGEEDHLRIISMQKGGDVGAVLQRLNKGIKEIESNVPFIRDRRLGWITYCPTNLGSTVRASVHIKLPKISARSDFQGGIYDISNKRRLGLMEFEAVKEMYDGVRKLIELEESS